MNRSETLNEILEQFNKSAHEYCENTNGLSCEITSTYKGIHTHENLTHRCAKINYGAFAIRFIYCAHGPLNVVNSILNCSVCLNKQDESTQIPLQLLTDYLGLTFESPMSLPFLTSAQTVKEAFKCISFVLDQITDILTNTCLDEKNVEKLLDKYQYEMSSIFALTDEHALEYLTSFRVTTAAFINYIKGNNKAAIKQLQKIKRLTGYEKRMLELWKTKPFCDISDFTNISQNARSYNNTGKELVSAMLAWLLITPLTSVMFLALYFGLVSFEGRESIHVLGAEYNYPYCILFGFLVSIFASYFARFKSYKLIYKKDYDNYVSLDHIQNSHSADKLMKVFLHGVIILAIAGCLFLSKYNVNFLKNGFFDNSDFFSLTGEYHSYKEIKEIYYRPDRVNGLGETLNNPSYIILLNNGEELDLYEFGTDVDFENNLLDFLVSKNVKIIGRPD